MNKKLAPRRWNNWSREKKMIFSLSLYEYAKSGFSEKKIAEAMGIPTMTLSRWKSKFIMVRTCLDKGKNVFKDSSGKIKTFQDFVTGRLSMESQDLWHKIMRINTLKNGVERLEALLENRGVRARQEMFFNAFTKYNFSISRALRTVNISRGTYELWKKDPEFLGLVEEFENIKGDFFEEHLVQSVANGETAAIIFANRTFNAKRGYGDSRKIDVNVNVSGKVELEQTVNFEVLPIKLRKQILKHHRKQIESTVVESAV